MRALAWTLLSLGAGTSTSSQTCTSIDKLSAQIHWYSQPEFAGWEVPRAMVPGAPSYADECLEVSVRPGGPEMDPIDELVQRKADVATAAAAGIANGINRGVNFTIIANYFQRTTVNLISQESGLSIRDLNGSNIGIWCCGYDLPIRMMFAAAGVEANFVFQPSLQMLYDGEIKAGTVMEFNELVLALQKVNPATNYLRQKDELSIFNPTNLGGPFLHNVVVVLTERLPELRDKLIRLLRVLNKAWLFCGENERACAESYPRGDAHFLWQMRVINQVIFPSPAGLGVTDKSEWDTMVQYLIAQNQLNATPALDGSVVIDNSMILASHSTLNSNDLARVNGTFTNEIVHFCAPYGSEAATACDASRHTLCPVGSHPSGDGQCQHCPSGKFSYERGAQTFSNGSALPCEPQCPARMLTCERCPAGRFQETPGATACELCPRGRFNNSTGLANSSGCETCMPGQAATESGSSSCRACAPGTYRFRAQDAECLTCGVGNFSSTEGATACQRCREDMTTLARGNTAESLCVCTAGTYRDLAGQCVQCKRGMNCAAGSSEEVLRRVAAMDRPDEGLEYPKLLPGFWTKRSDPLSVYLCGLASSCPGTDPETCVEKRLEIACGLCAEGHFHSGGGCEPCSSFESSGALYPWLPTVFGPPLVLLLYSVSRDRVEVAKKKWTTVVNACAFLTLLHYQCIGLLRGVGVNMPGSLSDVMSHLAVLVDVASVLHPECMGYREFSKSIALKVASPLHAVAVFILVYLGSRLVNWIFGKYGINSDLFFSVCMTVVQAFFVPIAFMGLQIFMCYRHPNGESSLNVAPQVLCGSTEWQSVVGLGVVAILLYVVGLLVTFSWVLAVAPGRYNNLVFRSRWKFLLLRQRVGMWWWSLAVLIKGLSLSLSQVLFERGVLQACWTFFTLLVYAGGLFSNPWLHPYANFIDTFGTLSLIFFVACVLWFTAEGPASEPDLQDTVAAIAQTISSLPLVAMIAICPLCYWCYSGTREPDRRRADATETLLKGANDLMGINPVATDAFLANLCGHDFNTLRAGGNIFLAELFGQQPGVGVGGFLDWRLVLSTDDRRRTASIHSSASSRPSRSSTTEFYRQNSSRRIIGRDSV